MTRTCGTTLLVWVATSVLAASATRAQSAAPAAAATVEEAAPPADSTPQDTAKKKGGLFGKAKKFVGDKTVQQVAKTVACNMVPGGQAIAGAIDAASSESVGDAAKGAAGAATGQTCMPPGLGGAMGAGAMGTGALGAGGGMPGLPGAAGLAGAMAPGAAMPMAGMAGMGGMGGMAMPEGTAACMGLTPEELAQLNSPTGGEARQPTKDEMKRQQKLMKKVDMARYQTCLMAQYSTGTVGQQEEAPDLTEAARKPR